MDPRSRLIEIIARRSYREGDFVLASGAKSSFYIDLKATTLSAEGARAAGQAVCTLLAEAKLLTGIVAVGGLTLGADPIATAVSIASLEEPYASLCPGGLAAFIVRKEQKGHGTSRWIEGLADQPSGSRVVVVEDVSTTGGSAWQAVERVRESGFGVSAVVSLVDRDQGAEAFFAEKGVPFFSLITVSEVRSRYRG